MNNLRYLSTVSVDEFKAQQCINRLEILDNKKTGKQFFAWGTGTGAVSTKFSMTKEPMVSLVQASPNEEPFILLHNRGEGATLLGTL